MGNLFNLDNGFFSFMGKVWDIIVLNLIWLICCLPIVTIGPATSALYYAMVKVIRRERGYAIKEYFHSFKDNLKVGTLSTLVFLVLAWILYVDYNYAQALMKDGSKMGTILISAFNGISIIAAGILAMIFPVLSRFTLGVRGLFKTTFLMAFKHIFTTIGVIVIIAVCGLALYIVIPAILFVPAVCCLICSFLIEKVFKKYMPEPEGTPEETGKDQWYLE
ncbi:MAG: DUF624 domain-containing protein [Lachnospiraceae bacterium]|nr:DUF624 domain-containing protein [Lachnospiraceae bacterium]